MQKRVGKVSLAALGLVLSALGPVSCEREKTVSVTSTEGTNLAATVSPDGQRIVFDFRGALWSVARSGGEATRLTDPFLEPSRPHWSPAGDWIAFQAFTDNAFHIWIMRPDGSGLRQLTFGHGDDREPRFSPDGTRIAFSSDRAFEGTYDIWVVDVASGALSRWTSSPTDEFEPDWLTGGTELAYVVGTGATGTTIQASALGASGRTLVTAPAGMRLESPAVARDGRVAYTQLAPPPVAIGLPQAAQVTLMVAGTRVGESTDVFPFQANWLSDHELLYTADGGIRIADLGAGSVRPVEFRAQLDAVVVPHYDRKPRDFDSKEKRPVKGIAGPRLSPDGQKVVFQALNQIWVSTLGERPRAITSDRYFKVDPSWSPDGKKIAYSSDKAGTEDLYIFDLASGAEQRVTSLPGAEYGAAWSPDGTKLAFQDQTTGTFTVDIATGNVRQVIGPIFAPSKPSWHASGATLAIAALKPYSRRFREGTSQILTVNVASGALTYTEPSPFRSISTRGDDGPVYSPDGKFVAFVSESALWIKPVDANGVPNGEAVQINDEATDAPSWSGDSQTLLYLSNGRLRTIARTGGAPRDIPLHLDWQPEIPEGRTVIHAGRFWDGRGAAVLSNVDIVIDGNRIANIRPHQADAKDGEHVTRIDASGQTIVPGLWEAHTHHLLYGKYYGDRLGRLWLAYGITSLNSVADPAYRAVEAKEAFESGQRIGPRFFPTGEAIDGERIYYNMMRPVSGGDVQLARELSRAKALDYDMIKTYVRLPHIDQAKVTTFAHDTMGVYVASHYMPALQAYPVDAISHLSGTTRTGFPYTRSATGVSYRDMRDLLRESGMFGMTTVFNTTFYADDPGMVEDARLLTLNTPWAQASLRAKRDAAQNADPALALGALKKEQDTVQSIRAAGGVMVAGTDSPLDDVATALHVNLRAQVKVGGVPPWQALQTATKLTAEVVGAGRDLGTLEKGKVADLVIVDGNPLVEINDLAKVKSVMKNGKLHTVEDLVAPFRPSAAALSSPSGREHRVLEPAPEVAHAAEKYWWHDPSQMLDDEHL
ncbi:amidohydrolase family protein [Pendulispora brunnea]|uniref:Amidohydrolase family protein n=1 Tax=Pendulispora brunnea TaxID=2905690 RepID=A0ABZ2JTX8_9BACT